MALEENSGGIPATMLVGPASVGNGGYPYPVYQNGSGNNGGFGGDWGWIVLLLLLAGNGGWGMGGFGGFGGYGNMMLGYDFPWLLNGQQQISNNTNNGFRDAQLNDSVTSVGDRVSALSTQLCSCCGDMQMALANSTAGIQQSLCNGFAGTTAAVTGAQNAISQQLYSNEIANLNRSFAEQTANTAGFTGVQSALCDIRYGNAANTQTVLTALNAGVQSIKDQLCQDKISAKDDIIAQLRQEVLFARGQQSQDVQTAAIQAGQRALANEVEQYVLPTPRPAYIVQNPNCCTNSCGCGGGF